MLTMILEGACLEGLEGLEGFEGLEGSGLEGSGPNRPIGCDEFVMSQDFQQWIGRNNTDNTTGITDGRLQFINFTSNSNGFLVKHSGSSLRSEPNTIP